MYNFWLFYFIKNKLKNLCYEKLICKHWTKTSKSTEWIVVVSKTFNCFCHKYVLNIQICELILFVYNLLGFLVSVKCTQSKILLKDVNMVFLNDKKALKLSGQKS